MYTHTHKMYTGIFIAILLIISRTGNSPGIDLQENGLAAL